MGIGNALKGLGKAATNPKNIAIGSTAALVGSVGGKAVDNATSTASPDVVIYSQTPTPTGTPSTASEGTLEWITAMMLLNGTGGFSGQAGIGGNGTDNPRLDNPRTSGGINYIIPIIIIGLIGIVIAFVLFGRRKRSGGTHKR